MWEFRDAGDFSLRDGDSLDSSLFPHAFPLFLDSLFFTLLSPPRSPCPGQPLCFSPGCPLVTYEAFPRPVDSLPPARLWYGSASPASLPTSSLLQATTRWVRVPGRTDVLSRTRLSASSTSLFPRPAQQRCTSPSRSATARSRCPRSFGPEASFTEWLGRINHWI